MSSIKFILALILLSNNTLYFNIITNSNCESCKERVEFVSDLCSGGKFIIHELSDEKNVERFQTISRILEEEFLPLPLFIIYENDELKAIIAGGQSEKIWENINEMTVDGVPIYIDSIYGKTELKNIINDEEKIDALKGIFIKEVASSHRSLISLIIPVSISALLDAFNPCSMSVLLVLLTLVFYNFGHETALKTGLAFISAIFITYYSIGLGILQTLRFIYYIKYFIIFFSFILGILKMLEFFGGKKLYLPHSFANRITTYLEKASNPRTGFIAGIISASLLMPCSSAPYFLVLNLLSEKTTLYEGLLLLGIYNGIIIIPFLIILFCFHTLRLKTMDMKLWMVRYGRWINLTLGLGLICLSIYFLFQ